MDIGIIGSGMIGATAARLFARAGHDVALANRRGPASPSSSDRSDLMRRRRPSTRPRAGARLSSHHVLLRA